MRAVLRQCGFGLRKRHARAAAFGGQDRARCARHLPIDCGKRAFGSGEVCFNATQFGTGAAQLLLQAGGATDHFRIERFELKPLLFGFLKFTLPSGQLLVDEIERRGHVTACAAEILLAEDVDHPLHNGLRKLGVFGIGQVAVTAGCGNLEQVLALPYHADVFGQGNNRPFHIAGIGDPVAKRGRADDFLEIDRAHQRLAHPVNIALTARAADADLFGKNVIQLHKDSRFAFIGIGDQRDDQPAEQAHTPSDGERQPLAVPHRPDRCADFLQEHVQAAAPLRTCFRG